ncbi:hypothetical protein COS55_03765 [Candidatus Shapirobacteria bacterium CG03_land_8_20_14_0_80_40_19]|uniref:LysM domain-containing protein n=4 Tax=Candidatus Shapironibacteriota TaxID=1752721 RepID=A0A2M7BB28_9BACT|nr:MAG: hypothetical protein COV89_01785 [Candidatus Shapirobacteria bacterium CG11_big_fil_rev_8_21_14_0_20_40_12]PIV00289.1 MAG: hypothetical protein COS55_03765 [Candidatus Shapirobacteria bacterium CG03_land_8_20_14_0_80_40_19]PJC28714.1 MAG: hypothetical protein CO053_03215 [Candidatus Shapirobacteria bacterium CG_4_9_14_0_2_um_filter_40_11]PJC76088.1 MAG: hypothetical protein CO010_03730 [Candidatus Shapirobacteria bacterium CG_4_8_14_3_um_filter_39_11]
MFKKEFNRRDFLQLSGRYLLGSLTANIGISQFEILRGEIPWNPVVIRQGDTFFSICDFYGVANPRIVALKNNLTNWDLIVAGQELLLPVSGQDLILPYKCLSIPAMEIGYSQIVTGDGWEAGGYLSDFAYCDNCEQPYIIKGHSSFKDPNLGFFGGLRKLKIGDAVAFSRVYGGDDGRWAVGKVEQILINVFEEEIVKKVNSRRVGLVTCMTEVSDLRARIAALVKIENYYATF